MRWSCHDDIRTRLSTRLADLLRRERAALAEFLLALADFDRERCWVELGHASLFYYLHRELGLSKGPPSTGRPPRGSSRRSRR